MKEKIKEGTTLIAKRTGKATFKGNEYIIEGFSDSNEKFYIAGENGNESYFVDDINLFFEVKNCIL